MMTPRDVEKIHIDTIRQMNADQKFDILVELWKSAQGNKQQEVQLLGKVNKMEP